MNASTDPAATVLAAVHAACHTPALADRIAPAVISAEPQHAPDAARAAILALDHDAVREAFSGVHPMPVPPSAAGVLASPPRTSDDKSLHDEALKLALYALSVAHDEKFGFVLTIAMVGMTWHEMVQVATARLALDPEAAFAASRHSLADIVAGRLAAAFQTSGENR